MSQVYNPEIGIIEAIERMALEARDIRRRIEHVRNLSDRRVMNRQLLELEEHVSLLQNRLPH